MNIGEMGADAVNKTLRAAIDGEQMLTRVLVMDLCKRLTEQGAPISLGQPPGSFAFLRKSGKLVGKTSRAAADLERIGAGVSLRDGRGICRALGLHEDGAKDPAVTRTEVATDTPEMPATEQLVPDPSAFTVLELLARLEQIDDLATLKQMLDLEHEGGDRSTALKGIQERIDDLTPES